MCDDGKSRGSKYRWISGKLYMLEPVVVVQWSSFWELAADVRSGLWNKNSSLLWLSQEFILLDSGNVTAVNTERLARRAVTSQRCRSMSSASVSCVAPVDSRIAWNEKIQRCASKRRSWWTCGSDGRTSREPGGGKKKTDFTSPLSHSRVCSFLLICDNFEVILDGHDFDGFHNIF